LAGRAQTNGVNVVGLAQSMIHHKITGISTIPGKRDLELLRPFVDVV